MTEETTMKKICISDNGMTWICVEDKDDIYTIAYANRETFLRDLANATCDFGREESYIERIKRYLTEYSKLLIEKIGNVTEDQIHDKAKNYEELWGEYLGFDYESNEQKMIRANTDEVSDTAIDLLIDYQIYILLSHENDKIYNEIKEEMVPNCCDGPYYKEEDKNKVDIKVGEITDEMYSYIDDEFELADSCIFKTLTPEEQEIYIKSEKELENSKSTEMIELEIKSALRLANKIINNEA